MQNKYEIQSKKYLKEAEKYLKKKNYTQSSEKFWGASAEMVKAVAEKEGFSHDGHAQLFNVIRKLSDKTKDNDIRKFFSSAHLLHINFYENWLNKKDILIYAKDVEKLIEKLKNFL